MLHAVSPEHVTNPLYNGSPNLLSQTAVFKAQIIGPQQTHKIQKTCLTNLPQGTCCDWSKLNNFDWKKCLKMFEVKLQLCGKGAFEVRNWQLEEWRLENSDCHVENHVMPHWLRQVKTLAILPIALLVAITWRKLHGPPLFAELSDVLKMKELTFVANIKFTKTPPGHQWNHGTQKLLVFFVCVDVSDGSPFYLGGSFFQAGAPAVWNLQKKDTTHWQIRDPALATKDSGFLTGCSHGSFWLEFRLYYGIHVMKFGTTCTTHWPHQIMASWIIANPTPGPPVFHKSIMPNPNKATSAFPHTLAFLSQRLHNRHHVVGFAAIGWEAFEWNHSSIRT